MNNYIDNYTRPQRPRHKKHKQITSMCTDTQTTAGKWVHLRNQVLLMRLVCRNSTFVSETTLVCICVFVHACVCVLQEVLHLSCIWERALLSVRTV